MKLTHFSLFTGIGGIDLAAEWAGFTTVGMCEIDEYCRKVLDKHWPDVPKWRDIFELTGEEILNTCGPVALLSGGFPCQPFSAAGKRRGEADERHLWPQMLRIIREVKPRWVVGENVRGLLSIDAGGTFGTILADLAENGYRVGWLCYGAGDIGAPHRRERVFIVAYALCEQTYQQLCRPGGFSGQSGQPVATGQEAARPQNGQAGDDNLTGLCEALAHTHSLRGLQPQGGECDQWGRVGNGGEELADTPRKLFRRRRASGENGRSEFADGGKRNMAHTCCQGLETRERGTGRQTEGRATERQGSIYRQGPTQPRLGGMPDGTAAGMDGNWPACPGEQHEWEPPRIATGAKDRVARLKALGNAVVPQQVYPILKAIAEIELEAQKGGDTP